MNMTDPDAVYPTLDRARQALATGKGKGIKIAVIDSGVEAGHPGLKGLTLADDLAFELDANGTTVKVKPGLATDSFGHGTAVAGIIHDIAPEAEIGSFRVLSAELKGKSAVIAAGAMQAIKLGYDILNCSLGCGKRDHVFLYKAWVDEAFIAGRHVVAACNNQYYAKEEWPAYFPTVCAVNFTREEERGQVYYRTRKMVSFAAAGTGLTVLWNGGRRRMVMGSSFAAPQVAAMLARLISTAPVSPLLGKDLMQRLAKPWVHGLAGQNEYDFF
jgi:subtilisin family serine protease